MKSRKASLELSINAIVILILAITMLGLGLGFMRNIFGSATQQFTQVTGEVEKQMIEQLKSSGKIVDLDRPKITVKRGDTEQIYIGFKNVDSAQATFVIKDTADGSSSSVISGTGTVWASDSCKMGDSTGTVNLEYKTTATSVGSGDVVVLPINVRVSPSATSGTCFYNLQVTEDTVNSYFTQLTVDVTV